MDPGPANEDGPWAGFPRDLALHYVQRPPRDRRRRPRPRPGSAAGRPDRGADRDAALYAEVRAMLFGRAVPGGTDSVPAGEMVRLTDAAERDRRSDDDGVGRAAATALPKTVGRMPSAASSWSWLRRQRRSCGYSTTSCRRGSKGSTASSSTRCRTWRCSRPPWVVELCLAVGRQWGHAPWLLFPATTGKRFGRRASTGDH